MQSRIHRTVRLGLALAVGAGILSCRDMMSVPDAPSGAALAVSGSPVGNPFSVGLETVARGLTSPVAVVSAHDGTGRLFIVDQAGVVRILDADGTLLPTPFLDVRSRMVTLNRFYDERGLLGLAFHPDYANNGRFFVYYSIPLRDGAPEGFNHTAHIAEFHVSSDPNVADMGSERTILEIDKPQSNHNGGTLAFGPDGYLYISIGDGGGANDVGLGHVDDWYAANAGGNGQDIEQNLLGNILRIDVDGATPYDVPADNPFVGRAGLDEIWAYGFRNPYRFSFDMGGELGMLGGDAGQGLWEEVSQVRRGGNYGWNVKEGAHCFSTAHPDEEAAECPDHVTSGPEAGAPLIDPVLEYPNHENEDVSSEIKGTVVVGGVVYRGSSLPQLDGRYVFGDWSMEFVGPPTGQVFVGTPRRGGLWQIQKLTITKVDGVDNPDGELHHRVLGFGQDLAGEVYLATTDNVGPAGTTGRVFRLVSPSGKRR